MSTQYQAGLCNIGESEVNYRKKVVGFVSATVALALYVILVFFNVSIFIYAVLLVPVFAAVHGFVEAKSGFCTSYAKAGKYNMASEVGVTQDVLSQDKRDLDRKFAKKLTQKSIKISLVTTVLLAGLSRLVN
jgi:hypothetical protein